ncbi:hypothetical protein E2C01_016352 [Portunus trituberculatus]|uniref:Uncharacterized protein n=1 Tax=Portunus trituberculatus TaxID=210409 RepID=A0A5B7DQC2_PORTR|nr:hypothetical protein [Portunus trituberculatus]
MARCGRLECRSVASRLTPTTYGGDEAATMRINDNERRAAAAGKRWVTDRRGEKREVVDSRRCGDGVRCRPAMPGGLAPLTRHRHALFPPHATDQECALSRWRGITAVVSRVTR